MVQKGGQPPLFGITAATMEAAASIFPSGPIHLALLGGGKKKKKNRWMKKSIKKSIKKSKKKNTKRKRKTLRFMRASLGKAGKGKGKGKKGRRKKGHSFKTKKKRPLR